LDGWNEGKVREIGVGRNDGEGFEASFFVERGYEENEKV